MRGGRRRLRYRRQGATVGERAAAALVIVGGAVLGWVLPRYGESLSPLGLSYDAGTAQATLGAIAAAMITLAGFVVTAITLVVQTVQSWSPRLVGALHHIGRFLLLFALLVGTALFALVTLSQVTPDDVPRVSVTLAVVLVLVDAVGTLRLLASLQQAVTGGGLAHAVAAQLHEVTEKLPELARTASLDRTPFPAGATEEPTESVPLPGPDRPLVLQTLHETRLVHLAREHDVRIELDYSPGDFIAAGTCVGRIVRPRGTSMPPDLPARMAACCGYGPSRTFQQDPGYGLRLLADIAVRALSPAVNDPTTAVQCLDLLEDALLRLSRRSLDAMPVDAGGALRLSRPAPGWQDLVAVALDETLLFSAGSPQVLRRLRALLDRLLEDCPPDRRPPVDLRVQALDRLADTLPDALFRTQAARADRRGLGGAGRDR